MIPRRPFGSTGVQVPVLGQGTWQLRDKAAAAEALRVGADLGMTHVDTAELYTGSEQVIREALSDRREELFLCPPFIRSIHGTQIFGANDSVMWVYSEHIGPHHPELREVDRVARRLRHVGR